MSLGSKKKTVKSVYDRIQNAGVVLISIGERFVANIDKGPITYIAICDDMIAQVRDTLKALPDSSGFPQAWLDRLDAYANAQSQSPSADYMADYEAVRSACLAVIAEGISLVPVDGDGILLMRTIDSDGYMTRATTDQTTDLKTKLNTLISAAS
jgi:hypothetical protein